MAMLQDARQNPILHINDITPSHVMEGWISKQANQLTHKPLLSSAVYGGKRLAVFNLFREHNGKGPMPEFQEEEMTALWKGFSRTIKKRKIGAEQGKGQARQ
jgi:hypothetical protein